MSQPWIVMMPEGWIKSAHPVMCEKCPKSWACKNHFGSCPLASAVKAVEVKSGYDVCWGENQAYDFHSRKPVTLFAVVKGNK